MQMPLKDTLTYRSITFLIISHDYILQTLPSNPLGSCWTYSTFLQKQKMQKYKTTPQISNEFILRCRDY